MKAVQTAAPAEGSNILYCVWRGGPFFADADKFLHRLPLFVAWAEVTLANGLPHELRDGSFLAACTGVKGVPEAVVEVKLRPPHDVYYTSPGMYQNGRVNGRSGSTSAK
jgi:hypothetical protein